MPTPSPSETPRVNTFLAGRFYDHVSEFKGPLVDFASELERELNQVNKDKEELATWYANMTKACKKSNQERDALKAEVEKWRSGKVDEEMLRKNDGYISVGHDCELAINGTTTLVNERLIQRKQWQACAERLAEALKQANILAKLVTVRQAIDAGDDAITASGLNPYCMNEGLANGSEQIGFYSGNIALAEFNKLKKGK